MRAAALVDGAYLITEAKPPRIPKPDSFTRDAAEFRNWYRTQMPIPMNAQSFVNLRGPA